MSKTRPPYSARSGARWSLWSGRDALPATWFRITAVGPGHPDLSSRRPTEMSARALTGCAPKSRKIGR